jgi:capsular exopolysaccharide synthesis family protein
MNLRYRESEHPIRSLLLTSVESGEGKTTIALHLARSWAETGHRVLLIEADLRSHSLARDFLLPTQDGLGTLLLGHGPLEDACRELPVTNDHTPDGVTGSVHCIPAGPAVANPLALLTSDRMRKALREAEERFDAVIVDSPPAGLVADAIPLLRMVGGVLVVTKLGRLRRRRLEQLRMQLELSGAHVLGVVLNGAAAPDMNPALGPYLRTRA